MSFIKVQMSVLTVLPHNIAKAITIGILTPAQIVHSVPTTVPSILFQPDVYFPSPFPCLWKAAPG